MAYELKEGQGSLFKNDKKERASQPDLKGYVMVGGEKCQLAAWVKKAQNGTPYYSIQLEKPLQQEKAESLEPQPDDLPFN